MNEMLTRYIQRQSSFGPSIMKSKTINRSGKTLPTRTIFILIQKYIKDFLGKSPSAVRWVVLPGIRGVGKTTILAQTYLWLQNQVGDRIHIIYISMDELVEKVGSSLSDFIDEYERLLPEGSFERTDEPIFLFIDEVQIDQKWARTLKFLYDRVQNIFIICSGSSATHLQIDADVDGRRATVEKLYPLSFPEYQVLLREIYPAKGLKNDIKDALYNSKTAQEVYDKLLLLKDAVDRRWMSYERPSVNKYLETGTIPFTLQEKNQSQIYSSISSMVDKVICLDMQSLNQFAPETIGQMKRLLMILTDCDVMTLDNMAKAVGASRGHLINMLDAFIKAELIIKVPAHGNNITATTNPSKYFFMSPAIRASFHDIVGITSTVDKRRGMLLEDVAALHFYREFVSKKKGKITHPYDKDGGRQCDFILMIENNKQIPIEMGMGTKGYSQVEATLKKHSGDYGLVFSKSPLGLNDSRNVVTVPLDYFFIM